MIEPVINEGAGMALADGEIRSEDVRAARAVSGLTQVEAAPVVYTSVDNWRNWEQGRNNMAPAILELFMLKTGQFTLRDVAPGVRQTVLRLRLRTGHVIEMVVKSAVAREIAGIARA
jgi:putative transcriptional regulator